MIAFTRAVETAPGDKITSREQRLFAAAINDRVLSGLGNAAYRIAEYWLGLFRSMVMGNDEFTTRAEDEYFTLFQAVEPNVANWPENGVDPGSGLPEPSGPNLNNPMAAWVWGRQANSILPESQRLMQVQPAWKADNALTKWTYGKAQRGAVDAITGEVISPARYLAYEQARFAFARVGLMGTSYGGYLPGPAQYDTPCRPPCDPPCTIYARENLDVKFTATRPDVTANGIHFGWMDTPVPWPTDPTKEVIVGHYNGTCLPRFDDLSLYATHINYWYETPAGYVVVLNNGVTDFLKLDDWVEGPYSRVAELKRGVGDQIGRAVNSFVREFRGSDGQRGDGQTYANENAFDFQRFFTTQYPLAPSYGIAGKGEGIDVKYPSWMLTGPGSWPSGTKLPCNWGGTAYAVHPGYVATHLFAIASVPVFVSVKGGAGTMNLVPAIDGVIKPISALVDQNHIEVILGADLTLAEGEALFLEINEVQRYMPTKDDLYVVLRKGGSTLVGMGGGDFANPFVDGQGVDEDRSAQIGDDLAQFGCIVNQHEVSNISDPTAQNENAVHEAARRMSKFFRLLNRFSVLDYAVQGGDSIIWFTPHPRNTENPMTTPGEDGDQNIDMFTGLNVSDRDSSGFSERWVMDMWLKAGDEAESSVFRTDVFSDQIPDINRCTFLDTSIQNEPSYTRHFNRGVNVTLGNGCMFAQNPDGYNYAQHLNRPDHWVNYSPALSVSDPDTVTKHCKSCQMYVAPLEIRKVERVSESNRDLIKVTFKGRLGNTFGETLGAPYEIARGNWVNRPDLDGWTAADVLAEPYRTAENGLRLYLLYRWGKVAIPSIIIGDLALTGQTLSQSGSIFPSFYFIKLMPEAALDLNNEQDSTDALFAHDQMFQAEVMLRAMSEGFVAGTGSLDCSDPTNARTYDCEWPSLIQSVSGLRSLAPFATAPTVDADGIQMLGSADVRSDGPSGYGPLPNTYASSEVFNRMVKTVNALTRVRVMLPWQAQFRTTAWEEVVIDAGADVDNGCGTASPCGTGATGASMATGQRPSNVGLGAWGAWGPGSMATAYTQHQVYACYGSNWGLMSRRLAAQLQFEFIDWDLYKHAIPVLWRDMMGVAAGHLGAICMVETVKSWVERRDGSTYCDGSGGGHTFPCDLHLHQTTTQECRWIPSGTYTLDAGPQPLGGWAYYWDNSSSFVGGSCSGGSEIAQSMWLLGDTTPVLEVPLSDAQEWERQPWLPL